MVQCVCVCVCGFCVCVSVCWRLFCQATWGLTTADLSGTAAALYRYIDAVVLGRHWQDWEKESIPVRLC